VVLVVLVTGGHVYYPVGLLVALYAAGCVVTARWVRGARWIAVGAALAVTAVSSVFLALPVFPERSLPPAIAALNQTDRDSIGWPTYVHQVAQVYQALPAADRAVAVLVAGNYGEAGALARFGPDHQLPTVYSGQNELYRFGPPPDSATVVVVVGLDNVSDFFASCQTVATLDNGVGVDNEEQGRPIAVCRGPKESWRSLWPRFQHYD
jgi:hypothetical protein